MIQVEAIMVRQNRRRSRATLRIMTDHDRFKMCYSSPSKTVS